MKAGYFGGIAIWAMIFCQPLLAAVEGAAAGKVLLTVGVVSAKQGGTERALQRKAEIFPGDTLVTGKDSQVQLRMSDGAFIALASDTEFAVKSYRFNQPGKKDEVVVAVIKGGLRTITGQAEKSSYRLETPAATLGIRGTIFEVHVAADGTTTVILREGGVDVTGQVGARIKMDLANLASIIKAGGAAGKPGEIPPDVLKQLQSILPVPFGGGSVEGDGGGGTVFTFDIDPGAILTNPETGSQPPTTSPDGMPPVEMPPPPPPREEIPPCSDCCSDC